ncbi:MAG: EcsC family protein [Aestuariivita sp.]|nr:EcsC family protein [Aestuariivita sp.]
MKDSQNIDIEIASLARRYRMATGSGLQLMNLLGGQVEGLIDNLPTALRDQLGSATEAALHIALDAASGSRKAVPDQVGWLNTVVATAMGAAGGFGGITSSLVELPVTTTILLRAIQGVSVEQGFDPDLESVRFDCIKVIGSAGPLSHDDGADLGFLSARLALSGANVQRLIVTIAPRLATALGQKLAAQTIPVLGAIAGAATNYVYINYYQEMAFVQFRLRRLALEENVPYEDLLEDLAYQLGQPAIAPHL